MSIKRIRVLVVIFLIGLVFSSAFIIANAVENTEETNQNEMQVIDLFETENAVLRSNTRPQNGNRYGVRLVGKKSGSSVKFVDPVSGVLDLGMGFGSVQGLRSVTVSLYDTLTGESCDISFTQKNDEYSIDTNGDGQYLDTAKISAVEEFVLHYKPEEKIVSIGEGYSEIDLFETKDSFSSYEVRVNFDRTDGEGEIFIYSVNGQSLDQRKIDISEGTDDVFADVSAAAVAGKTYDLPKPYTFRLGKGNGHDANVSVVENGNTIIDDSLWSENLNFQVKDGNKYTLRYRIGETVRTYALDVVSEISFREGTYSSDIISIDQTYGVGSTIAVPNITMTNESINVIENHTLLTVYFGDQILSGWEQVPNGERFITFENAGEYKFVYSPLSVRDAEDYELIYRVSAENPAVSLPRISSTVLRGQAIEFENVRFSLDGASFESTPVLYQPDNSASYTNEFTADKLGYYEVVYSAAFGDKTYEYKQAFNVVDYLYSTGNESDMVSFGGTENAGDGSGLTVRLNSGSYIRFNKPIDISTLSPDVPFANIYITPEVMGEEEFSQLEIRLTNRYDENNYLRVTADASGEVAYYKAGGNGQQTKGDEDGYKIHVEPSQYGQWTRLSFAGTENNNLFKFYFDKNEKAVYVDRDGVRKLVMDMDDPKYYSDLWEGFTSDEVYVTITANKFIGATANFVVADIYGCELDGTLITDEEPPELTVNAPEDGEWPDALVGRAYPLFEATAYDSHTASDTPVSVRVFRNYGTYSESEISVVDHCFIPVSDEVYTVEYMTEDVYGNRTTQIYHVRALREIAEKFSIVLGQRPAGPFYAGKEVALAESLITGGVGKITVQIQAECAGKEILNDLEGSFIPSYAGNYIITYLATDYLGFQAQTSYSVTVEPNTTPIFNEFPVMPVAFVNGVETVLPKVTALDYSSGAPVEVVAEVYVTDGKLTDQKITDTYTPSIGNGIDSAIVKYKAGSAEKTFTFQIVDVFNDNGLDLTKYFIGQDINVTANSDNLTVQTQGKDSKISFIKDLMAEGFSFIFDVSATGNSFGAIDIVLTDAEDPSISVRLTIEKNAEGTTASPIRINGGNAYSIAGSFYGNSPLHFTLNYDSATRKISDAEGTSFNIETTEQGNAFAGFPSGKVRMTFEIKQSEGNSEILLYNLNGQRLNDTTEDLTMPKISLFGELGGEVKPGQTVTIPRAIAMDVLSFDVHLYLTVLGPDGEPITSADGILLEDASADRSYEIQIEDYGIYNVQYFAEDNNAAPRRYNISLHSNDDVPPVVTISQTSVQVKSGKKVNLPKVSVAEDNGQFQQITTLTDADGIITVMTENSFTPKKKGVYKVTFMAVDGNNNVGYAVFTVTVI